MCTVYRTHAKHTKKCPSQTVPLGRLFPLLNATFFFSHGAVPILQLFLGPSVCCCRASPLHPFAPVGFLVPSVCCWQASPLHLFAPVGFLGPFACCWHASPPRRFAPIGFLVPSVCCWHASPLHPVAPVGFLGSSVCCWRASPLCPFATGAFSGSPGRAEWPSGRPSSRWNKNATKKNTKPQ